MPRAPATLLPPDWKAERKSLRQMLRARRRALSPQEQQQAAQRLALRLLRQPEVRKARRIAFYWPADGEISPLPFAKQARLQGKTLYLPVLRHFPAPHLVFARWQEGGRRRRNRFGIPEPVCRHYLPARSMDLLLMPLVGFDASAHRLGMGGGFYDRTLAFKHGRPAVAPCLVGIAHHCQQVPALPQAGWDVPLQAVVTDHTRHC